MNLRKQKAWTGSCGTLYLFAGALASFSAFGASSVCNVQYTIESSGIHVLSMDLLVQLLGLSTTTDQHGRFWNISILQAWYGLLVICTLLQAPPVQEEEAWLTKLLMLLILWFSIRESKQTLTVLSRVSRDWLTWLTFRTVKVIQW